MNKSICGGKYRRTFTDALGRKYAKVAVNAA